MCSSTLDKMEEIHTERLRLGVQENLHPEVIRQFEIENNSFFHSWSYRCQTYDLSCKIRTGNFTLQTRVYDLKDRMASDNEGSIHAS